MATSCERNNERRSTLSECKVRRCTIQAPLGVRPHAALWFFAQSDVDEQKTQLNATAVTPSELKDTVAASKSSQHCAHVCDFTISRAVDHANFQKCGAVANARQQHMRLAMWHSLARRVAIML
eukprot:549652-Prymnesium_polylepis.4